MAERKQQLAMLLAVLSLPGCTNGAGTGTSAWFNAAQPPVAEAPIASGQFLPNQPFTQAEYQYNVNARPNQNIQPQQPQYAPQAAPQQYVQQPRQLTPQPLARIESVASPLSFQRPDPQMASFENAVQQQMLGWIDTQRGQKTFAAQNAPQQIPQSFLMPAQAVEPQRLSPATAALMLPQASQNPEQQQVLDSLQNAGRRFGQNTQNALPAPQYQQPQAQNPYAAQMPQQQQPYSVPANTYIQPQRGRIPADSGNARYDYGYGGWSGATPTNTPVNINSIAPSSGAPMPQRSSDGQLTGVDPMTALRRANEGDKPAAEPARLAGHYGMENVASYLDRAARQRTDISKPVLNEAPKPLVVAEAAPIVAPAPIEATKKPAATVQAPIEPKAPKVNAVKAPAPQEKPQAEVPAAVVEEKRELPKIIRGGRPPAGVPFDANATISPRQKPKQDEPQGKNDAKKGRSGAVRTLHPEAAGINEETQNLALEAAILEKNPATAKPAPRKPEEGEEDIGLNVDAQSQPAPLKTSAAPLSIPGNTAGRKNIDVASLYFNGTNNELHLDDMVVLDKVASLHREHGGIVQLNGYAAPVASDGKPRSADDSKLVARRHAMTAAKALMDRGVPPAGINIVGNVETLSAPGATVKDQTRVEIQFRY